MYDPTRLAALVAVSEAGSITRAAARLGYTAPALSQQLAKLEREAGAALLVRHHRGARLTAAGELLAGRARRVLDEMDQARHELASLAGLSGGRLRVGTFVTAGIHLLPPVLTAFRRAHPDVELAVTDYEPPAGVTAVAAGDVDLALTHAYEPAVPHPLPAGLSAEPLLVEELVLVTALGQMLSEGSGPLPVAELAGRPLISSAPDHPPRRGWSGRWPMRGPPPRWCASRPATPWCAPWSVRGSGWRWCRRWWLRCPRRRSPSGAWNPPLSGGRSPWCTRGTGTPLRRRR